MSAEDENQQPEQNVNNNNNDAENNDQQQEQPPAAANNANAAAAAAAGGGAQQQQQQQQQQQPPLFPVAPAKRVYSEHTDAVQKLWESDRHTPTAQVIQAANQRHGSPAQRVAILKQIISKYELPWETGEFALLLELAFTALGTQAQSTELGGMLPNQAKNILDPRALTLLAGNESPLPSTVQVLFMLMQDGYTHITILSKKERAVSEPMSLGAYTRKLLRACRAKEPFGYYGMMPPAQRLVVYAQVLEFMSYCIVPVEEAKKSIHVLLDELQVGDKAPVWQATANENEIYFIKSIVYQALSQLMAYPPQEGNQPDTKDLSEEDKARYEEEKTRPDSIQDPETQIYINRGDCYLKACELSLPGHEVENARRAAGVHPKDFSALGFPMLSHPTLDTPTFQSPFATVAACVGILTFVAGVRYALLK